MGNSAGFLPIAAAPKDGSTLASIQINDIRDAHGIIGERPDTKFTPVVLEPQRSHGGPCGPCCWTSIPAGFGAIVRRFGATVEGTEDDGTWSAGCHCFNPMNTVDFLVTKQLVIFDTPVKECKNKDSINISLDVMLVFWIEQAEIFTNTLGPERLDDMLRSSQDEVIRQLAHATPTDAVNDMRGQDCTQILEDLNEKFSKYGVKIKSFTIKSAKIADETIAQHAEDNTLYPKKTEMDIAQTTYDRQSLNNQEAQNKLAEECENARRAAEQKAELEETKAKKDTEKTVTSTDQEVKKLISDREMAVKQVVSENNLMIAKLKSQIVAEERAMRSQTEAEVAKILAEADVYEKKKMTEAQVKASQCQANGKRAMGEAEGEAASAFQAKRAFEADQQRLQILSEVVKRGMVCKIAGSQENTVGLSADNAAVTQVVSQGLEALRAKLADITVTSLAKLEQHPKQVGMSH